MITTGMHAKGEDEVWSRRRRLFVTGTPYRTGTMDDGIHEAEKTTLRNTKLARSQIRIGRRTDERKDVMRRASQAQ